jgi:hypothetical protein
MYLEKDSHCPFSNTGYKADAEVLVNVHQGSRMGS